MIYIAVAKLKLCWEDAFDLVGIYFGANKTDDRMKSMTDEFMMLSCKLLSSPCSTVV